MAVILNDELPTCVYLLILGFAADAAESGQAQTGHDRQ
jgi:hypothetical protein